MSAAKRAAVTEQIGHDIYTTVEGAPMSFVADGGRKAIMLAMLAVKRLEEAGWQPPEEETKP